MQKAAPIEFFFLEEADRRLNERDELKITGLSRTTRWRLARDGRYPPKSLLGPWLSEVLSFCADPDAYRYSGDLVVGDAPVPPPVKLRQIRRRAVRSHLRHID